MFPTRMLPPLDLLCRGDTLGITQLESPAMETPLIQMQPIQIEDIIQTLAARPPGPASLGMKESFIRKHRGLEPHRVLHPRLASLLADTHGVLLYEDDALFVVREVTQLDTAGGAGGFASKIAKHRTEDEAEGSVGRIPRYVRSSNGRGGSSHGTGGSEVQSLHVLPQPRGELWLDRVAGKRVSDYHPLAFWTAALNNARGSYPRVYIESDQAPEIKVRLPCVNRSLGVFKTRRRRDSHRLRRDRRDFHENVATLLGERERNGQFQSLTEFCRRVPLGPQALAQLICCGAFDWTERTRPALFFEADLHNTLRDTSPDLFGSDLSREWTPENYDTQRRLLDEWRLLEFVIGPPLLSLFRRPIPPDKAAPLIRSDELSDYHGRRARLRPPSPQHSTTITEDDRPLQFITLEDEHGLVEVTLFPGTCPQVAYLTMGPYLASGVVDKQYGVLTVTAHSFERFA